MLYIVMALITGMLVILSMIINSSLAKRIGIFYGAIFNYLVGSIFIFLILFFTHKISLNSFTSLSNIPFWAYLGAGIGVMVVAISNIVIPKIPTLYSTLLIFIGQVFTGILIDSIISDSFSTGKLIGSLFITAGMIYNVYVDKKTCTN